MIITRTSSHTDRQNLLQSIGAGIMSASPYDTAWIARLGDIAPNISQQALDWLRANQLGDGSWGTAELIYHHERLVCTLSAMNALARYGDDSDIIRIGRAQQSLGRWVNGLKNDAAGETIGFELIIPTLIDEANALGIIKQKFQDVFYHMAARRAVKLSKLPNSMINRHVTAAFSSELVGQDALYLLDVENLQEENGSVAYSPAATVFFALNISSGDEAAMRYLHHITKEGSAPNNAPIDIFEVAWTLWNLSLHPAMIDELRPSVQNHLDLLEEDWKIGQGTGACVGYSLIDSDDSSIVYDVLTRFGREGDLSAVMSYEADGHFLCFPYESNPSISANIHVVGALQTAQLPREHPSVQKVLNFLKSQQVESTYWHDKWHVSPYYSTSHAILACMNYAPQMVENAVSWLVNTQNEDGSWGYYIPSAEETAYCLQALLIWSNRGRNVPKKVLETGTRWLRDHQEPPYPMLWVGKSLYTPHYVVQSAILSALWLSENE